MNAGALEVGGTHVSAAVLAPDTGRYSRDPVRLPVDSHGPAEQILATFAGAVTRLDAAPGLPWGVAMPDPFDYPRGIGRFHGVGKYEALAGVDVRAALLRALPAPSGIVFVNDADAFALGEAHIGAGRGHRRCVGLTLGTGVGSGWVVDGAPVSSGPGVPRDGRIHHAQAHGAPLEDTMSRRAIRRAYAKASGDEQADVREIAERARAGEAAAVGALRHALVSLGEVLSPRLRAFTADVLVVGGSMARSWDLVGPWLREGLGGLRIPITVSQDAERSALTGAAVRADTSPPRAGAPPASSLTALRSGSSGGSPGAASASG